MRKYIDALADGLLIWVLPALHENPSKRQVKMPKVYFRDSGIAHSLLGMTDERDLLRHVRIGATWEGWIINAQRHRRSES